jgi:hypothetical protein
MEDDRVHALAIALRHVLRHLERSGALTPQETAEALDDALEQMRAVGSFSPEAHKMVGRLYLPI